MLEPKHGVGCGGCPLFASGIPVLDKMPLPGQYVSLSLVGEMPGFHEVRERMPFVGPSGALLYPTLEAGGIDRDSVHITNAVRCGLARGQKPSDSIQREAARCCLPQVLQNLREMGARCVCALGGVALESLTGLKGIMSYRGTVLPPDLEADIPWFTTSTLHPAAMLHQEAMRIQYEPFAADLAKAGRLALGSEGMFTPRVRDAVGDLGGLLCFADFVIEHQLPLAVDVETLAVEGDCYSLALQAPLVTIGLSAMLAEGGLVPEAWSIPWRPNFPVSSYDGAQWLLVHDTLTQLFSEPGIELVFHNAPFDMLVLENHFGFRPKGIIHDTLLAHHASYPKVPKKLQYVASQFFAIEPWKDSYRESEKALGQKLGRAAKAYHVALLDDSNEADEDLDEKAGVLRNLERRQIEELLWYNAQDAAATIALHYRLETELRNLDVEKVYDLDLQMMAFTLDWTRHGIMIDVAKAQELEGQYQARSDGFLVELQEMCGLGSVVERNDAVKLLAEGGNQLLAEKKYLVTECPACDHTVKGAWATLEKHIRKLHPEKADRLIFDRLEIIAANKRDIEENKKLLTQARAMPCSEVFNPRSEKQLHAALAARQLRPKKVTKTGKLSTSKDSLWELREDPFVETLFRYRGEQKILSTYLRPVERKLGPDGRIHPTWKLHATPSGRFGTQPAVQNWPKSMGALMVAPPGRVIVGADFNALELRISALLAGQTDLIEAFLRDEDIHARHAGWFFGPIWEEVHTRWLAAADNDKDRDRLVPERKRLRGSGKPVTFGKIYRAGARTLYETVREERLDVRTRLEHRRLEQQIEHMHRILDERYPLLGASAEAFRELAEKEHCLRTFLDGRIRKWPMGDVSLNEACNHPIQGMAGDLANRAMLRLERELRRRGWYPLQARVILQIHDAFYIEALEEIAQEVAKLLEECMRFTVTAKSNVTGKEHTMEFHSEAKISRSVARAG